MRKHSRPNTVVVDDDEKVRTCGICFGGDVTAAPADSKVLPRRFGTAVKSHFVVLRYLPDLQHSSMAHQHCHAQPTAQVCGQNMPSIMWMSRFIRQRRMNPWNKASRLNAAKMKGLMIDIVNKTYLVERPVL